VSMKIVKQSSVMTCMKLPVVVTSLPYLRHLPKAAVSTGRMARRGVKLRCTSVSLDNQKTVMISHHGRVWNARNY